MYTYIIFRLLNGIINGPRSSSHKPIIKNDPMNEFNKYIIF